MVRRGGHRPDKFTGCVALCVGESPHALRVPSVSALGLPVPMPIAQHFSSSCNAAVNLGVFHQFGLVVEGVAKVTLGDKLQVHRDARLAQFHVEYLSAKRRDRIAIELPR